MENERRGRRPETSRGMDRMEGKRKVILGVTIVSCRRLVGRVESITSFIPKLEF